MKLDTVTQWVQVPHEQSLAGSSLVKSTGKTGNGSQKQESRTPGAVRGASAVRYIKMEQKTKIIIDEALSEVQYESITNFLKQECITYSDVYFISKEHPGIPDYQIIKFLLNDATIFFTTDRPLHNTVLSKGYKSYFFNGVNYSSKWLKGIRTLKLPTQEKKDSKLKDNYHEPKTGIRQWVLPESQKALKKLRTKRRRIRNCFGGLENMDQISITISYRSLNSSNLIGIKFRIASNNGIKALDASESYIKENNDHGNKDITALSYALILSIQLMLHSIKTIIYFDTQKFDNPQKYLCETYQDRNHFIFKKLLENFKQIEFIPSSKGVFIERLRQKLINLSKSNSNEIVRFNIHDIGEKIKQSDLLQA